jgi:hypothetical protein
MKLPRRQFLHFAAGVVALPALSGVAWAQIWPTRPVRIIAGFPPGGGVDLFARLGPVRDVVGILRGVISGNMIISYYTVSIAR